MRTRILISIVALGGLLFLNGCQTWFPGGTTARTKDGTASITVPAGWMFTTATLGASDLVATKDGVLLQTLTIEHHELKDPLKYSKRTLSPELSPFEVAEALIDDLRADHSLLNFELIENLPATVGGHGGFKIVFRHQVAEPQGLTISKMGYGAIVGKRLYVVTFGAPARHYFDRDVSEVEAAIQSLVLTPKKA